MRVLNEKRIENFGLTKYGLSCFHKQGVLNPELRRSELRIRFTFERSIKDFIWLSLQTGLRYNWAFNLDDGNFFRGFGNNPYLMENTLSNAFYANISINLVSP